MYFNIVQLAIFLKVISADINWKHIEKDVKSGDKNAIVTASTNFANRPSDFITKDVSHRFFQRLLEDRLGKSLLDRKNATGNSRALELVKSITAKEFSGMNRESQELFTFFLDGIAEPDEIPEKMKEYYINKVLLRRASDMELTIKGIPAEWIKEDGSRIVKNLARHSDRSIFSLLNNSTWEEIVRSEEDLCSLLPAEALRKVKKEKLSVITPRCFAKVKHIDSADLSHTLKDLQDEIFAYYDGKLAETTTKKISGEKMKHWGSQLEDEGILCTKLRLNLLNSNAIQNIPKGCLGYFESKKVEPLKKLWAHFPVSHFQDLKSENFHILSKINVQDFAYIPTSILQIFFSSEEMIENLPTISGRINISVETLKKLDIKAENFSKLVEKMPIVASRWLTSAETLPDNILSHLSIEHIRALRVDGKDKVRNVQRWKVLEHPHLKSRTNYSRMISSIGDHANTHPCSSLSLRDYLELPFLRDNVGKSCKEAISFEVNSTVLKRAPELSTNPKLWKEVVEEFKINDWKELRRGLASTLFASKDFVNWIKENKEVFNVLPNEALQAVEGQAAHSLQSFITPKLASKLADNAFSLYTATQLKDYKLIDFTPAQVSYVSCEVDKDNENFFATVKPETIQSLDKERLSSVYAKAWSVVPLDVMKILSADMIRSIYPENLTNLTDEQISALPEPTLLALDTKQIAEIGRVKEAKLGALDKVVDTLSVEQKDALNARRKSASESKESESTGPNYKLWIAVVIGLIIVLGILFYFIKSQ